MNAFIECLQIQVFIFFIIILIQKSKINPKYMRPHRTSKLDWSKPFKMIDNKREFDDLQTNQDQLVINIQTSHVSPTPTLYHKEDIITPQIKVVERVTQVKSFAKISPNYIRLQSHLNLPKLIDYELTQVDHVFLKGHSERFKFNGKVVLNKQFLTKIFIQLQLKAGKDPVIPRNKGWMTSFIQKQYKQLIKWEHLQSFSSLVYNYWKNRRQQLKFPILRPLWRPNQDQYNHLLAFKIREKEKRNLRKTNRISEDQIINQLNQQFEVALKTCQRIQMRQELKIRLAQVQMTQFHNECKAFANCPDFFGEVNYDTRVKDKDKLKKLRQGFDYIKGKRDTEIVQIQQQPVVNQVYDQKLSVANFLSTVIAQAEVFGISYSSLFQSRSVEVVQHPVVIQEPQVQQEYLNLNLKRVQDYLIRTFESEDLSESEDHTLTADDFFDLKKKRVCSFYFGDDDQGDFKDLKKNISNSFKKFQMLTKNISE